MISLMISVLAALAAPAGATPDLVLLLRHGHKSGDATNYNLSARGWTGPRRWPR